MKDVFEDGYVDVAVFQPTYLNEWYTEGFNTTERNGALPRSTRASSSSTRRWDPRDGDAGLKELEENVERWGSKGVKLYTAEWNNGSRGWKLNDPAAYRYLEKSQELGIKNIHVHKGPTIWPLDKDAFDVSDVDHAATDFPDLNFIVEHVGLPRIEDFCFMATQEPNVYAGLSVVIGGLMHARPQVLRQGDGRAAVLGRRGQDDRSAATTASGSRSGRSRASSTGTTPVTSSPTTRGSRPTEEEDPRPERRQALRHRGARRLQLGRARARRRPRTPRSASPRSVAVV